MRPSSDRSAPIGRGPKVRAAVLAAAMAELADTGYSDLTVEAVARRSGVHKTTVYRRWKDRESLITDAVTELAATDLPIADTQDIDADLIGFARSLVRWLTTPAGQALVNVLASDAARRPPLATARRAFFQDRFRRAAPLVREAVARGQLPAGTDPAELVRAVIAPIYLRLLVTGEPIDDATAQTAARIALSAARAGVLGTPPGPEPA